LLTFDEVTDKTKLAPFFMAHGVNATTLRCVKVGICRRCRCMEPLANIASRVLYMARVLSCPLKN